jgi:tetratricopeptide (TPR) repeat protein
LIVTEAAHLEDIPIRLILPHDRDTFRQTSVESYGVGWTDRYDRLLTELDASSVEAHADDPAADDVYQAHNGRMLDRAAQLSEPGEHVWCLVIRPTPTSAPSVSDDLATRADTRGCLTIDIDPTASRDNRAAVFVAMPYGRKFDPVTRRTVDCDGVFRRVYVPVLEDLDLEWQRADLEADSGIIHVGMIDALANADLVIADLFTGNANVGYELGLRHALARRATLITRPRLTDVSKTQTVPFDVMPIRHLAFDRARDAITDDEAATAVVELRRILRGVLDNPKTDSPVFAWFDRDATGRLTRRDDHAEAAETETAIRALVRAAVASSSPDQMREVVANVDDATLGESARRGLRFQLAVALTNEGAYEEALALFRQAEPPTADPLRLRWLQQHAVALNWHARARAADGYDPTGAWDRAEQLLDEARAEFGDTEESCGIAGGLAKRRFRRALDSGETVRAGAALHRMIELYRRGFRAEPNFYAGVNLVASLRLDLQHFNSDPSRSIEIDDVLPVARFFASREADADSEAFWPAITLAELTLHAALLSDVPDVAPAVAAYAQAVTLRPPPAWRSSAADQLRLCKQCGDASALIDPVLDVIDS